MRFANLNGRLVLAIEAGYVDVARASDHLLPSDPGAALDAWATVRGWVADQDSADLARHVVTRGDAALNLLAPVPRPRQVFAIGLNYRRHILESNFTVPDTPAVFTKFPSSITGPDAVLHLPPGDVDWEVELVVAIGSRAEHVSEDVAWEHVAGVMVGQDLSERRLQLAGPAPQFSLGKSFPGFAPVGPELVTVDELADPDDLVLGCALEGGDVLQTGRTADLVFPVPELIARLSAVLPLLPGDLIFTGTPSGVGHARTPPVFLQPGDVLLSWIDGVGRLRNPMAASTLR